jgi:hypothetical protein
MTKFTSNTNKRGIKVMIRFKPTGDDSGMKNVLSNLPLINELSVFVDLLANHDQEQISNPNILWMFKETDEPNVLEFHRFETNNSGLGISVDILNNQFFHKGQDENEKFGLGIFTMGEKTALAILTKTNESLRHRGIELLTKMESTEKWLHIKYDSYNKKVLSDDKQDITYQEALDRGLPVDTIGDKCGTWSKYYIDTSAFEKNWFKKLEEVFNSRFSGPLKNRIKVNVVLEDKNGKEKSSFECKPAKYPSVSDPYLDVFEDQTWSYKGDVYKVKVGWRPTSKMKPEIKSVNERLLSENRTNALNGLKHIGGTFRDNTAFIVEDKETGYVYHSRQITGYSSSVRGRPVVRVLVDKDQITSDITKNYATLGEKSNIKEEGTEINNWLRKLFPENQIKEDSVRDEIVNILRGLSDYNNLLYIALCDELGIEPNNYGWARKEIVTNYSIKHKKLDIYIPEHKHIIELKLGVPDPDLDLNQILSYGWLIEKQEGEVKRITTMGVSNDKNPSSKNSGFGPDLISKFETQFNTDDKWNTEFSLLDMRYFGLDKLLK